MADSDRIMMLFSIVTRGNAKKYMDELVSRGMIFHLQLTAHGTAPSEMMDIFGLGSSDKDAVISFAPESLCVSYVKDITKNFGSTGAYGGLMMCFHLSAINRLTAEIASRGKRDGQEKGGKKMSNTHKQQLILITVNQGFTDQVMATAKKAGAMGGTILRARLASGEQLEQYGDFTNEEKEIIAILAPVGAAARIMDDVNSEHGFNTDAGSIITALPVEKAYKI